MKLHNIGHALLVIPHKVLGLSDNHSIPSSAHPDNTAMSVANSNTGGTTFKFVASNGGAPQKRRQVAQACESCRKRKKRCHHTESATRSSVVSNHVHHSPSSTSHSTTSQPAPIDPQSLRSSGVEGEQNHTQTSPATLLERNGQGTEPIGTAGEDTEIQVCRFSNFISLFRLSHEMWYIEGLSLKTSPHLALLCGSPYRSLGGQKEAILNS